MTKNENAHVEVAKAQFIHNLVVDQNIVVDKSQAPLATDTMCALRLLMGCFDRQGIDPTSTDAYKVFRDFAAEHKENSSK